MRTAIEALAAVLGGTNSLHTNALDEVLALPSERAAQIALRTQQVIAEETGVLNVADPLGGSWFVEALTDQIEAEAEEIFARIRALGGDGTMTAGILRGIEDGWFIAEIADSAFAYQRRWRGRQAGRRCQHPTPATSRPPLEILRVIARGRARSRSRAPAAPRAAATRRRSTPRSRAWC